MSASYLYLAEIVGRGVKVGISVKPIHRLAAHDRDARAYGCRIGRTWISPIAHENARQNEAAIKGESKREYLDRGFDDCLRQALDLPMIEEVHVSAMDSPVNQLLASIFPGYEDFLKREAAKS